jgi:hypothetical protein
MSMFRKKPIVVEAFQFLLDAAGNPVRWGPVTRAPGVDQPFCVVTIHGQETVVVSGDWIITEPDGVHHYPCKPDIFEATYGPVDATGGPPAWAAEFDRPATREILVREVGENEYDVFESAGARQMLARRLCFDEAMACTSAIICQHRLPYLKSVEQEREYIARYEKKPLSEKEA